MSAPKKHGENRATSRLYRIWTGLRNRCHNSNAKDFPRYGGRGITVCLEWDDYLSFRDWAQANGYDENLSIDRIDTNGPYTPENCRWSTTITQNTNKRTNKRYTAFGETKTVSEWGRDSRLLVSYETFRKRLQTGWSCEEALSIPAVTNQHRKVREGGVAVQEV